MPEDNLVLAPQPAIVPPMGLPPGGPTFDGFKWFVSNIMAVPAESMPDDAWLQVAYDQSYNLAYWALATVPSQPTSPNLFSYAVYNLGCAMLLEFAQDDPNADPPSTFWAGLRSRLNINSSSYGLINAAADQGTSEAMYIPEVIKGMTLLDLQLLKSPWGRMYLMIAGEWGTIWGLTI